MAYNIEITKGIPYSIIVSARDADGPIDLTGFLIYGHVKKRYSEEEPFAEFDAEVMSPADEGKISIDFPSDLIDTFPSTQLLYRVVAESADDTIPILSGYINVNPPI